MQSNLSPDSPIDLAEPTVLVVDDEPSILGLVQSLLASRGVQCQTTGDPRAVLEILASRPVDVILTDIRMNEMSGVELLERAREIDPEVLVILMTGQPSVETAVRSLKARAYDYVTKPFELDELYETVHRALEVRRLSRENAALKDSLRLYQISQAVSAAADEREVVDMVVDSVAEELDAAAVVLFVDGPRGLVPWRRGNRVDGAQDASARPLADRAFDENREFVVGRESGLSGGGSAIAVPLRSSGQAIGSIVAFREDPSRPFGTAHLRTLGIFAANAASAIEGARHSRRVIESRASLVEANASTIGALVAALDAREHDTRLHSVRVTEYALRLAREIDYPASGLIDLKFGAMLHDIGKIGLSDKILLKPGPLTDEEWQEMRRHPMVGYQILREIKFLERAAKIVLYHQERWDGSGYPVGLKGDEIPLGSRLFAVADTFDAMTSDRPYREALGWDATAREIEANRDRQFDPAMVDAFFAVPREEWERIRANVGDDGFHWSRLSLRGGFASVVEPSSWSEKGDARPPVHNP